MKKIAISQPRYLPSCNYVERIMISDIFVMLDTVEHQKRAFEHRNKVRTPDGDKWLSLPVDRKKSKSNKIKDIEILNIDNWEKKHLQTFERFYKKTPYYNEVIDMLNKFYSSIERFTIDDITKDMIDIICNYLEIESNIVWASDFNWEYKSDDLLIEIVEYFEGDAYISGPNGRNYIDKRKFDSKKIKLLYHEYEHPVYEQVWGEFMPYMTIWDAMFYKGKETKSLINCGELIEY